MGCSVIQCLDCQEFSWEGSIECQACGSNNLTISFHQLLSVIADRDPEFKEKINKIYNKGKEV